MSIGMQKSIDCVGEVLKTSSATLTGTFVSFVSSAKERFQKIFGILCP